MHGHPVDPDLNSEREARRGLIPVHLDAALGKAVWLDFNGYHFQEGFFADSLRVYSALRHGEPWQCSSNLDFLRTTAPAAGCIYPSGFIFHAGRCGSTLLSKALARSWKHLVFSEAAPHNQIWHVVAREGEHGVAMYRNLVLQMGRLRLASHDAHIVKFTSFNIVQFAFIRAAFPKVPALFLFRDPQQILSSYHRGNPPWMGRDTGTGKIWRTAESAVEDFFRAALSIRDPDFRCFDYAALTPDSLPDILRFFHADCAARDLDMMRCEFQWDAKSGLYPRVYSPGTRAASRGGAGRLEDLYAELKGRTAGFPAH